jgi:hypothetical protein
VPLWDQFQKRAVDLARVEQFCDAVDKNGEGIINPAAHLTCYGVRRPAQSVKPHVMSTDQLDQLDLDVQRRRSQLCVPSVASLVEPSMTATASSIGTSSAAPVVIPDTFEMYKIKYSRGASRFQRLSVTVDDPFMGLNETIELRKPVRLGVPTDMDDNGINNDMTHLNCYSVKARKFKRRDVEVKNDFRSMRLTLRKLNMLCVPSYKEDLP